MANPQPRAIGSTDTLATVARNFVQGGGRIMLSPEGALEATFPLYHVEEGRVRRASETSELAAIAYATAEDANRVALARMVARRGASRPNGWRVWEAGR